MWDRPVTAEVDVPPVVVGVEVALGHAGEEHLQAVFTLAAADDLADALDEDIHRPDRFAIGVALHVERLQRTRIVVDDDRLLEVFLGQVAFVFGLQVNAPLDGVFELLPTGEEDLDGLGVAHPFEVVVQNILQRGEDRLVDPFVEELHVLGPLPPAHRGRWF